MTKVDIARLKQEFSRLEYPEQQDFWDWLDSFYHKDEAIPIAALEELPEAINAKYDKEAGEALEKDIEAIQDDFVVLRDATDTSLDRMQQELDNKADLGDDLPTADGTASPGTAAKASRIDHVHPAEAALKSANGYVKLPSGIMMQWGIFAINYQSPMQSTVAFPAAFTGTPYSIVAIPTYFDKQTTAFSVAATAPSPTNFIAKMSQVGDIPEGALPGITFSYVAFGAWK